MKSALFSVFLFLAVQITAIAQFIQEAETVSSKKLTQSFLNRAMQYPVESLTNSAEGRVRVGFVVQTNGMCTDFHIIKGVNDVLNREAIRLLKKILWKPATENGKPIASSAEMDIVFNKKQYLRHKKNETLLQHDFQDISIDTSGQIFNFALLTAQPYPLLEKTYRNLNHYINSNLKYPEAAKTGGIQGSVKLGFVVEEDGIASNIHILESVGGGCDQEAIRILESLHWFPGIANEKRVRSQTTFDVVFKLNENRQHQIPNRQSGGL